MRKSRSKRFLSAFLCVCMVAVTAPMVFAAEGAETSGTLISTSEELVNAIAAANDGDTITLGEGTFSTYNNTSPKKKLTFVGSGSDKTVWKIGNIPAQDKEGEYNSDYSFDGCDTITFKNMKMVNGTGNYMGLVRIDNLNFENCVFEGRGSYWGYKTTKFTNCTFNAPQNDYALWDYSSQVMTFDGCTFNVSGKTVNAYVSDVSDTARKLVMTGCTVNSSKENKAVLNIKNADQAWDVEISNTKVTGLAEDATTGSNLYQVEKTGSDGKKLTVSVDGKTVWKNGAPAVDVAEVNGVTYTSLADAVAAAEDGDTVKLLKDVNVGVAGKSNFWIKKSIVLDLGGYTVTGMYQLALGVKNADAVVTVQNGYLAGGSTSEAYIIAGKLIMDHITVKSNAASCAIQNIDGELELNNCNIYAQVDGEGGIYDYTTNHKTVINNSTISTKTGFAIFHNGSTGGFVLEAKNSVLKSENAQAVYISGSMDTTAAIGKNQQASFTDCNIIGSTGIEGKYTDVVLSDCSVTATAPSPTFEQYNNGSTTDGFAVVSTDNTMSPESPTPTATIIIDGGKYAGLVGLSQLVTIEEYPDFKEATYIITDGLFTTDPSDYCAVGLTGISTGCDDYKWTVGTIPANNENKIDTATATAKNDVSIDSSITDKNKVAAEKVANTVASATELTDKSEITETDKQKGITELKKVSLVDVDKNGKITGNKTVTIVKETYLDVNVIKFDVSGEDPAVTMDITPKYNLIATVADKDPRNDSNSVTIASAQPMKITAATNVSVTLPEAFKGKKVYIDHNNGNNFYIATANEDGKIEFTTNGFSPFTFALKNQDVVAEVNGNAYKTLQEAANAADYGDEITVVKNTNLDLNFAATKSVKVTNKTTDKITVKFNGVNKEVTKDATETFSYTKSSSSSRTTYNVITSSINNGGVNVSSSSAAKGATITITLSPDKGYKLDKLTVTDNSGKSISTTKKSDTVYTFVMPASQVKVSVSYVKDDASVVKPVAGFDDVAAAAWYADAVKYAVDKGMMNGVGNNKFAPDGVTDRGMIVTILYRLENEPTASAASFTDVASGAYYANAVAWASANSIVTGYGNGKFGPNDPITREQFASILYRYAQYKKYDVSVGEDTNILSYTDAQSISSYAVSAIQWACGAGVMNGSNGRLSPKSGATRAQAAQLLMNFCENAAK